MTFIKSKQVKKFKSKKEQKRDGTRALKSKLRKTEKELEKAKKKLKALKN